MPIQESELILNPDGSIYHLQLKPENIANTIITVGDPERVNTIANYFDTIEFKTRKREFHTQTGTYQGKRLSVISTGIGTDNIDIVFNELDALVNIDFEKRTVKKELTSLNFIRIGTSGAIQNNIPLDSFLISKTAIGFDSLLHYYEHNNLQDKKLIAAIERHLNLYPKKSSPYAINADTELVRMLSSKKTIEGITATNVGFYAPQGRKLRAKPKDENFIKKLTLFDAKGKTITNLEMETSGIYAMAKLLGHRAVSINAIIANRITGQFSQTPEDIIRQLIEYSLQKIVHKPLLY